MQKKDIKTDKNGKICKVHKGVNKWGQKGQRPLIGQRKDWVG